jgi:TonB-linked SusC/RagA family outer membrane protein
MKKNAHLRISILLGLLLFSCFSLIAQETTVSGKVVDQKTGTPKAGVSVKVKNSSIGTTTNQQGEFTLQAPSPQSIITISHIGYKVQEFKASESAKFGSVTLAETDTQLDEVIVVGYGTQKNRNVTGSIVQVDLKKIEDMPVTTVTEALKGQVPGLNITGGSTRPGVQPSASIRQQFGLSKDGSSPVPLIVIDDVIQLDPSTGNPSMDQFNLLDLSEVESITVLRDASAAIYGSRASQGAIVIKTKKGKNSPPKISYSGKFEMNDAVSHVQTMSAYEHGIFANRFGRAAGWANTSFFDSTELVALKSLDYDWRKEAWKKAGMMQHSINVSGGSDRATYFAGGSYMTQGDNLADQDYNRWTFRAGLDVKVVNNVKLTASLSGNNFDLQKSFTKVSINDGSYTNGSEQTDYSVLNHMPKYIPWMYNVNGVDRYISPALGPNRVQTTPVGQNNISGWNYFGLMNNGSNTNTKTFSYSANFALQYDLPYVPGLSFKASFARVSSSDHTEQVMLPQMLSVATNTASTGSHLYGTNTTWFTGENKQGSRVSYGDVTGTTQQWNLFANYDRSFGLHNVSALAAAEGGDQVYDKIFMIYDAPLSGAYNGASTSAGTLNVSNTYKQKTEGGTRSYFGRINYNYDSRYLLQFQFRSDASTKFAPENYWGFFPSVSAGWVISSEKWFQDVNWIDNLKIRASWGKTGKDNLKPWRWLQLYSYAADKGFLFGSSGGGLGAGLNPDPNPNRDVKWDNTTKQNIGIDAAVLKNRLSASLDFYYDKTTDLLTQMAGQIGVPVSVGGAFAEQNYASINASGYEISLNWRDKIGKLNYGIGMNFAMQYNKVTKYFDVPFNYPAKNDMREGYTTIYPAWGFKTWKGTSGGDGLLRTDADITAYWQYLTDLATKAGTTASYLGLTTIGGIKKGMLAYEDQAGNLDAINKTIAGKDGRIEKDQDYVKLANKNQTKTINTNLSLSWNNINFAAQIVTSWGGYNRVDYVKQGTSSGQIFWSHESYLTDMFDSTDNPNGKYPNLFYFDQNSANSDFWQISTFRAFVRSMSIGYTLPRNWTKAARIENARLFVAGYNLWDLYNPYPKKYRNMYDNPTTDYPTLRTWALGINLTF